MKRLSLIAGKFLFLITIFTSGIAVAQYDTLSFIHITDLHVIFSQQTYPPQFIESRKNLRQYDQAENRLREFFLTVPLKTKSDMVVATGDLVDFYDINTDSDRRLGIQVEQFAHLLEEYNTPVLLTLGNHDIFSYYWQDDKLTHTQNAAGKSRAAWSRNLPVFRDGTYYSRLFTVGKTNYHFLFLDNSFYRFLPTDTTSVPYMDKSQLYWLNEQLSEAGTDPVIIFMNFPCRDYAGPENTGDLFKVLTGNPAVKLIFAGHFHKNSVTQYNETIQVQTGSLAIGAENWRLIKLTEDQIMISTAGVTKPELSVAVK